MVTKFDAVLKKDDIERIGLPCDNLLLPEVRAKSGIFGGDKQAIRKNNNAAPGSNRNINTPTDQADVAEANSTQNNVEPQADLNQATDALVEEKSIASAEDFALSESDIDDIIPDSLHNFDERMTLARLKRLASEVRNQAIEKGYLAGQEQGRTQAAAAYETELQAERESLRQIAEALGGALSTEQDQLSTLLREAVTMIAKVYCNDRLQLDAEHIKSMVDKALSHYAETDFRPSVSLCSEDLALLKEHDLLTANCDWHEDVSLSRGGCLVKGKYSDIDFTLEEQISQISSSLFSGVTE